MTDPAGIKGKAHSMRAPRAPPKPPVTEQDKAIFWRRMIIIIIIISAIGLAEFFLFVYGQFSDPAILEDTPEIFSTLEGADNQTAGPGPNVTVEFYTVQIELEMMNRGRVNSESVEISAWLVIINGTGARSQLNSTEDIMLDTMGVLEVKKLNFTFNEVPVEYDNSIEFKLEVKESGEVTERTGSIIKEDKRFRLNSELILTTEDLLKRDSNIFIFAITFEGLVVLGTVVAGILVIKDKPLALAVSALGLAPLFRIVNVATPIALDFLVFVTMSYGFLLVAVFIFIYVHKISWKDIGVSFDKIHVYLPLGIFLGFVLAPIEYIILGSPAWIPEPSVFNILVLALVMFLFVGLAEELMFRSLIQTYLEKLTSPYMGLLLTSILFGLMHGVWTSYPELVFTFAAGLVFGWIFMRTRNLPFIAILHGAEDIFLFGLLPFIMPF
jgi:membrane protease YdiL (CAAX protease family)